MASRMQARWRDLDHSQELLLDHHTTRNSTRTTGPIPEFLAKKAAEREPKTYEWYREALTQLWTFLEERQLVTLGDFDEHAVNLFRLELRRRGLSENTISNRLRAIKAFSRWLAERGWTDGNVLEHLHVPQSTKPTFDLIDDERRARLLQLYSLDTYLGSRNLAMLGLLSDTGVRREELVNLQLKNLDLDSQILKVYSDKTEEWRYLPVTDEVIFLLRNHLRWRERYFEQSARLRVSAHDDVHRRRRPRSVETDRLFVAWDGKAMTPHGFAQILTRASRKLGVRFHAHLFRHDWITRKAMDGESPSVVKRWAGHKSYMMTDYYFSLAGDMLGAIKPKRSVLTAVSVPGINRRGRPPKAAVQ